MELFREPKFLIFMLLANIGLIVLAYFASRRKNLLAGKIAQIAMFAKLIPAETKLFGKIKMTLFILGVSFIFIALALPQWGIKFTSGELHLRQAVIAVDTSLSMLAGDVSPSRMENAKMMFRVLVGKLEKYRTGIIAFSSDAHVHCPVTTDADALKYFVSQVFAGMLPTHGTRLSAPIRLAGRMLSQYPGKKALLILTDGEDHEKGELEAALKDAKELGIVIFTIGIGSPQGSLIRIGGGENYKLDENDNPVVSRLDEDVLIKLAAATGGAYIRYSDAQTVVEELSAQLENLTKVKWKGTIRQVYKNRYQIPLTIAVVLLLLELIIPARKLRLWQKK